MPLQPASGHGIIFEVSPLLLDTSLDLARRKGLYRHTTTQHRNTKTNIHAPSGIQTRDPSNQELPTYALDRTAT
jgi:hypothetical protein